MVMEMAMKELIKWMKFWLDIPNYIGSKAREGKLKKADVTPSRGKGEKGEKQIVLIRVVFGLSNNVV